MEFAKLHGTGNDFVVIDARTIDRDWSSLARTICDRHFGVGGDGLILATTSERAPVRMRIFNADGSEAEMSGNGMRCLVKFAVDHGIVEPTGDAFNVETGAGMLGVRITTERGLVTSVRESMGPPRFGAGVMRGAEPSVSSGNGGTAVACAHATDVHVDGRTIPIIPVSMGNPHAVYFQDAPVAEYPLHAVGPLMEHHSLFPNRTNFEVVRVLDREHAEMRVWERGVGETLSCGSGASATMVAARLLDLVDGALDLRVPGGELQLEWDGEGDVILTGPVVEVFRGTWPD